MMPLEPVDIPGTRAVVVGGSHFYRSQLSAIPVGPVQAVLRYQPSTRIPDLVSIVVDGNHVGYLHNTILDDIEPYVAWIRRLEEDGRCPRLRGECNKYYLGAGNPHYSVTFYLPEVEELDRPAEEPAPLTSPPAVASSEVTAIPQKFGDIPEVRLIPDESSTTTGDGTTITKARPTRTVIGGLMGAVAIVCVVVFIIGVANKQTNETNGTGGYRIDLLDALHQLETVPTKGRAPKTGYSRDRFGQPWTDNVDVAGGHNGCDTRNDILARDLSNVVKAGACVVASGVLHDPYTGTDVPFDRDQGTDVLVQIDHVVPLLDAWQKGAQEWDPATRVRFANDPMNLLAVSGKANRMKKSSDIATWLPKKKNFRCDYVAKWIEVKAKYGLWMTEAEHDAAGRILRDCLPTNLPTTGISRSGIPSTGVLPSTGVVPTGSARLTSTYPR